MTRIPAMMTIMLHVRDDTPIRLKRQYSTDGSSTLVLAVEDDHITASVFLTETGLENLRQAIAETP